MPDSCESMPAQAVHTADISPPLCSEIPIRNSTHMDVSTAESSNDDCHVSIGGSESQPEHQEAATPTQVGDQAPEAKTQSSGPSNIIKVDEDVFFRLKHSSYLDYLETTVDELRDELYKYGMRNNGRFPGNKNHQQASGAGEGLQVSFQIS